MPETVFRAISDIFRMGVDIAAQIWDTMDPMSPLKSLGALFASLIMLFCFVLMAAEVLLVKCESYIVMGAGIVLLGFGRMRYFRDYAVHFLKYGLTVAVKIFVLYLMMGLILSFSQELLTSPLDSGNLLIMIGAAVVMLMVTRNIPSIISSLLMGAHGGGGGNFTNIGLMAAAGAIGGAVGNAVGGGINAGSTVNSSIQAAKASGATGAGLAAQAARNIAASYGSAAMDTFTGAQPHSTFGRRASLHATMKIADAEPQGK